MTIGDIVTTTEVILEKFTNITSDEAGKAEAIKATAQIMTEIIKKDKLDRVLSDVKILITLLGESEKKGS